MQTSLTPLGSMIFLSHRNEQQTSGLGIQTDLNYGIFHTQFGLLVGEFSDLSNSQMTSLADSFGLVLSAACLSSATFCAAINSKLKY